MAIDPAYLQGATTTGIAFPWSPQGPQAATDSALVKSKMRLVLFTFIGAHKMEPTFGSNLIKLVFENSGRPLQIMAEMEIMQTLGVWLPDVLVTDVRVTEDQRVEGLVTVDVDYEYLGQPDTWSGDIDTSGSGSGGA